MNTFFTELAKSMNEGQIIDMRIAKTGEELALLIITKGKKNLNISGIPEEVDADLLTHITTIPERTKGLKATTSEPEEKDDDDKASDKKGGKKTPVKKAAAPKKETVIPVEKVESIKTTKSNSVRYSDKDLEEFRVLVASKIDEAEAEINGIDDETLYVDLNEVDRKQIRERQSKFIQNLQAAIIRINNKTYGICRVTGKLIPKERLLKVPHATLAIEAKQTTEEKTPAPPKTDPKADAKAESARIDNEFKVLIHEGKKMFEDKSKGSDRYKLALDLFNKAKLLKPGDADAIQEANKSEKWVNAMAEL